MSKNALTSVEMAHFVTHGYLRFDGIVPDHLNQAVLTEISEGRLSGVRYNQERLSFPEYFAQAPAYASLYDLPQVSRVVASLVGANPAIDHCALHSVFAKTLQAQFWHADATIDPRTETFDIQVYYFPHDTPLEAGGTLILPGSHYRRVHETTIARYQNIQGQVHMVCPAGTILCAHHNLWHCSQPNRTANHRYMIKLRLNATVPQTRLFDTSDLHDAEIPTILSTHHAWPGAEIRLEILQRLRLWRYLTQSDVDVDLWLSRLENHPAARTHSHR